MKKLAIVGAGGLGREVFCMIQAINSVEPTWEFIGFFDDGKVQGSRNEYGEILGGIEEINNYNEKLAVVIAIANGKILEAIHRKIENEQIYFPNIITPNALFYDKMSLKIGVGNIIGFQCIFSCCVEIGNFNIFSVGVTVGHDLKMGNYNAITNRCSISGQVSIEDRTFWGATSMVLPSKKVASDSIIGAGCVVHKDLLVCGTYVGNPAKKIK